MAEFSRDPIKVLEHIKAEMCRDIAACQNVKWHDKIWSSDGARPAELWCWNWGTWTKDSTIGALHNDYDLEVPDDDTTTKLDAIVDSIDANENFRAVVTEYKYGEARLLVITAQYDFFSDYF